MEKKCKLYYTTDVHGYFYPTNYKQTELSNQGLFAIADAVRSNKKNTLLLDCGDMIQGSPFLQYLEKNNLDKKIVADIVNDIGYDFIALGNHDFNFGYDVLKQYVNNVRAKVLCCNLVDKRGELDFLPYYIETLENGLRIGIIGAVTHHVNVWESKENLEGLEILPVFEQVKKVHDAIKADCDILICLYHGGYEHDVNDLDRYKLILEGENIGLALCKKLNFDLILTGHQHMMFPGKKVFGTHTLQIPSNASYYAEVDIICADDDESVFIKSKNLAADARLTNTTLTSRYSFMQEKVQDWLDIPVGRLSSAMTMTDPLFLMEHGSPFANLCNSVILEKTGADMCCTSLMNEPYPLTETVSMRDIVSSYPFTNEIITVEILACDLKSALEQVASFFVLKNGQLDINPKYTAQKLELYNFDFYSGIEYTIDVRRPIGDRIVLLQKDGKDLNQEKIYTLGLTGYRASGTGGYDMFKTCKQIAKTAEDVQQMLTEKIIHNEIVELPKDSNFKVIY